MFKKILYILLGFILLAIIGLTIFISSAPSLPPNYDPIIEEVLNNDLPELVKGQSGFVENNGVKIWYESIEPQDSIKGTIMLFMGISSGALSWPQYFLDPLVEAGYQVIRYDHRGLGQSDWLPDWQKNPYSLEDMGDDAIAILDKLGIEKAHILGVSMGGMIAQSLVIHHPNRSLSLISIMSSGYIEDPNMQGISLDIIKELVKLSIRYGAIQTERNMIKLQLASRLLLMGEAKYDLDVKAIAEETLYILRKGGGFNSDVSPQHSAAVSASGSRYEGLKKISLPTLIIHGKSDPLMPFSHGQKCAELMPHAQALWIDNMGHDIAEVHVVEVIGGILGLIE